MMTFCMPIDFVYKCACLQGSHRSGKSQEKLLILKGQEKVRPI